MREAGVRADLVAFVDESLGFAAGKATLDQLLRLESELDAVFCVTDVLAAGILFECARRDLRVPQQLAVAGFGDYEIASEISPKLTTVRTRSYEIGVSAADLLVGTLRGEPDIPKVRDVGYELVLRESL
ncbi:hypothetical protein GCM10025795_26970 [Verticiella sediminum]